jgi:hypothetical protein
VVAPKVELAREVERLRRALARERTKSAALKVQLTEAGEQQTATSEVLTLISRSAFDLQRVLETLVENAVRLGASDWGYIYQSAGDVFRVVADHGVPANLAARLCGEAGAGQILISDKVAGGVEDLIDAEEMGPLTLKGLARPVRIWNVRGLAGSGARQGARAQCMIPSSTTRASWTAPARPPVRAASPYREGASPPWASAPARPPASG